MKDADARYRIANLEYRIGQLENCVNALHSKIFLFTHGEKGILTFRADDTEEVVPMNALVARIATDFGYRLKRAQPSEIVRGGTDSK